MQQSHSLCGLLNTPFVVIVTWCVTLCVCVCVCVAGVLWTLSYNICLHDWRLAHDIASAHTLSVVLYMYVVRLVCDVVFVSSSFVVLGVKTWSWSLGLNTVASSMSWHWLNFSVSAARVSALPEDVVSALSLLTFRHWLEAFLLQQSYLDLVISLRFSPLCKDVRILQFYVRRILHRIGHRARN